MITSDIYCIETPDTGTSEFTNEGSLAQSSQLSFQQERRIKAFGIRKTKGDDFLQLENFIRKVCLKNVKSNPTEQRSRGTLLSNSELLRHLMYCLPFGVISSI